MQCRYSTALCTQAFWRCNVGLPLPTYPPSSVVVYCSCPATQCAHVMWQCSARVLLPIDLRQCGNVLKEFHCPLPQGNAAKYCSGTTAHCPAVWLCVAQIPLTTTQCVLEFLCYTDALPWGNWWLNSWCTMLHCLGGSGQQESCKTLLHCLGAVQRNTCNTPSHCLGGGGGGAVGVGTSATYSHTACGKSPLPVGIAAV